MVMTDRYVVTSRAGEHVVATDSLPYAERCLAILGGEIIDRCKITP